ncbi:MAG TPA: S26 family signal peptidase, partial [Gemmatales bacterium]|nr:S26 family signal peptidase [Gemmatales bacterium]
PTPGPVSQVPPEPARTPEPVPAPAVASDLPPAPPAAPAAASPPTPMVEVRDNLRETLETIAFVVCLVLLLKAFVAEAYVIPTGSMATTLYGDHSAIVCERCQWPFTVNNKVSEHGGADVGARCQNCQLAHSLRRPVIEGGDKVLVLRPQYDFKAPERYDTFVFKFPGEPRYLPDNPMAIEGDGRSGGPQEDFGPRNFIKRLWGLPGEKLAIWQGDIYLVESEGDQSEKLRILRRSPELMLTMRRLVNDNQYLAPNARPPLLSRWQPDDNLRGQPSQPWKPILGERSFESPAQPGDKQIHWLRYRHVVQPSSGPHAFAQDAPVSEAHPQLITDHLAYNEGAMPLNWCRDLMLEAVVEVQEARGELVLELNAGCDSHRVHFDLATGVATLKSYRNGQVLQLETQEAATKLQGTGRFRLRFANFDYRLTLWVNDELPFGDGVAYEPPAERDHGPRLADLQPASIGVRAGKVTALELRLWRDIYYTRSTTQSDVGDFNHGPANITLSLKQQQTLAEAELRNIPEGGSGALPPAETALYLARPVEFSAYYPQSVAVGDVTGRMPGPKFYPIAHPKYHPSDRFGPDEFFALGDNSPQSKDSRYWGQVPERLLLGKAVWVYWPPSRFGPIR